MINPVRRPAAWNRVMTQMGSMALGAAPAFVKKGSAVLATLFLFAAHPQIAHAAPISWDAGGGANVNWSNSLNWNPDDADPSGDTITLGAGGSVSNTTTVTNIVDSSYNIASLSYVGLLHTFNHYTDIGNNQTLTVSGSVNMLSQGSSTIRISGANGSFVVNAPAGTFLVGASNGGNSNRTVTLNMTGLDTFDATVATFSVQPTGSINAGNTNQAHATLATTNTITATTLNIGNFLHDSNAFTSVETFSLGQSNLVKSNTITIGGSQNNATVRFRSDLTGTPTLTIRNTTGGRTPTVVIGQNSANGINGTGLLDLTLGDVGTIDASITDLTLGKITAGNKNAIGTMRWAAGTVDATTVILGQRTGGTGIGNGTMNLSGTATLVADTITLGTGTIAVGTMTLDGSSVIKATTLQQGDGAGATFTWNSGTIQNKTSSSDLTIKALAGTLNLNMSTAGPHVLHVDPDRTATIEATAVLTGSGDLTKTGDGMLTLLSANSYTGTTTVSAGILAVNGSLDPASAVTVNGGTLQGSGSIGGSVTINGGATLAAGNSIESLAMGNLSLIANSTFAYELDQDAAAGVAGDLTAVTGNLSLDLGNAAILSLAELGTSGSWDAGEKLTLISYSGAWNGGLFTYDSNVVADDSTFLFNGVQWMFNYNDTVAGTNYTGDLTGTNFVTMSVVAIPEPSTLALLGVGSLGLLHGLRRRRLAKQ